MVPLKGVLQPRGFAREEGRRGDAVTPDRGTGKGWAPGARAVALLGALALAGCVATAQAPPPRGVAVSGPPPAPLNEERPTPPGAGAQWVAGYWHWTGMQYAWIPGHWETPPPGAVWAAPRYVRSEGAYFYEAGAWHGGSAQHANALR
jgi:hypothetical protein